MRDRPAVAVVVPGGIGIDENIPSLLDLLGRLSASFDLSIYSFSRTVPHPALTALQCTISFPPARLKSGLLKAAYFLWLIRRDHRIKKYSIIHGFWVSPQGFTAVVAGKMLHLPSVVSIPGGDITYLPSIRYGGMSDPVKRSLVRWSIRSADRVSVLTRYQKRTMEEKGISCGELSIIPFGADDSRFMYRPRPLSAEVRFIYIGNLNRVKDPFTLVKAFSIMNRRFSCSLTIIGTDTLGGRVEEYARELGVNEKIHWRGQLPHEVIPSELHSSDFLLLTSLYEGQAAVVMEAYACGTVVVGTNVGLLADTGDDRVTVSAGDPDALADAVEGLLHQPGQILEILARNRLFAEAHSAEWTYSEYKKMYGGLLQPVGR